MDDDMYQFSPTEMPNDYGDDDMGQPGGMHPLVPENAITPKVPRGPRSGAGSRLSQNEMDNGQKQLMRNMSNRNSNAAGDNDDDEDADAYYANLDTAPPPPMPSVSTATGSRPPPLGPSALMRASSRNSNNGGYDQSASPLGGSRIQRQGSNANLPPPPSLGGAFRPSSAAQQQQQSTTSLPPRPASVGGQSVRTNISHNAGGLGERKDQPNNNDSISMRQSVASQLVRGNFNNNNRRPSAMMMISGGGGVPTVVSTTPSEIKTNNFTTEDRRAVSKMSQDIDDDDGRGPLFMPGVKREQFIPVRIAREKIKEVLSEMAQMKQKHLGAIETMEKQHQFLKNQLETACAAYAKKLTNDYNTRVSALDAEYCRRLAKLSGETAAGEVEERLRTAREATVELEKDVEMRLEAKDKEMETFKAQLTSQLDRERAHRDDLQTKLKASEDRTRELELQRAAMSKDLDALRDGVPLPIVDHHAVEERLRSLQASNDQLQQEAATMKRRHDEETLKLEEEITALEAELHQVRLQHDGGNIGGGGGIVGGASALPPAHEGEDESYSPPRQSNLAAAAGAAAPADTSSVAAYGETAVGLALSPMSQQQQQQNQNQNNDDNSDDDGNDEDYYNTNDQPQQQKQKSNAHSAQNSRAASRLSQKQQQQQQEGSNAAGDYAGYGIANSAVPADNDDDAGNDVGSTPPPAAEAGEQSNAHSAQNSRAASRLSQKQQQQQEEEAAAEAPTISGGEAEHTPIDTVATTNNNNNDDYYNTNNNAAGEGGEEDHSASQPPPPGTDPSATNALTANYDVDSVGGAVVAGNNDNAAAANDDDLYGNYGIAAASPDEGNGGNEDAAGGQEATTEAPAADQQLVEEEDAHQHQYQAQHDSNGGDEAVFSPREGEEEGEGGGDQ